MELQRAEDRGRPLDIHGPQTETIEVERHRSVGADRHQLLRAPRIVGVPKQRVAVTGGRDLLRPRQDRFQVSEACDEAGRGLLADAGHAGDVVRRVAEQRQKVGHPLRRHAEPLLRILRRHPHLVHARGATAPRIEQHRIRVHQLVEVLVAGDDDGAQAPPRSLLGERSDDVVRLPPIRLDHGHAEGVEHLAAPRQRGPQLVRHLFTRRLVFRVDLAAEAVAGVERDAQVVRLVVRDQTHEEACDSVRGGRVLAALGGERAADHGEVRPVNERVAVEQEERRGGGGRHGLNVAPAEGAGETRCRAAVSSWRRPGRRPG